MTWRTNESQDVHLVVNDTGLGSNSGEGELRVATSLTYDELSMSLGPTAEPKEQETGKVRPGMVKTGQSPRKDDSLSVSRVADMTTTLRGTERPLLLLSGSEKSFFKRPRRMSCNRVHEVKTASAKNCE